MVSRTDNIQTIFWFRELCEESNFAFAIVIEDRKCNVIFQKWTFGIQTCIFIILLLLFSVEDQNVPTSLLQMVTEFEQYNLEIST